MNKKTIVIKKAEGEFGKSPEERTIEELINYGIINIDKPKGPTSHLVVDYVKKILKIKKAGHSGTLDPAVTGVQPIALSRATRITHSLLTAPKEYVGIIHLHKPTNENILKKTIKKFIGEITQLPPVKSAVKREKRKRKIYDFQILEIENQDLLFRVKCQAGTYVRKIAHDLGQELKIGAHLTELRRTQAGPFTEKDSLVTLTDLQDAYYFYKEENNSKFLKYCLQPIENAVKHLSKVWILDTTIQSLTHGRDLAIPGIAKLETFNKDETIAILTLKGELVAIGTSLMPTEEIIQKDRGLAIKIKKVFMEAL